MKQGCHYPYSNTALKAFIAFIIVFGIIASCKKDDSIGARPVPACFISESVTTDRGQIFSYDGQYRLTRLITFYADPAIAADTLLLVYGADNRLAKTYYTDYSGVSTRKLYDTLVYDDGKAQVSVNTYYLGADHHYSMGLSKIVSKVSGRVQSITDYYVWNGSLIYYGGKAYEHDSKGNVSKMSILDANKDTTSAISFTYDNKVNPHAALAYTFLFDLMESPNNPTSSTTYFPATHNSYKETFDMKYSITNVPDTVITTAGATVTKTTYFNLCH